MKYRFPNIKHLDDVRDAIDDSSEFIIAERGWGYVVNYMVATPDTFPPVEDNFAAIRRECRGIVFDKEGNIIARRLHKFFNVNEKDETQLGKLDLSLPHVILEKLDGSMITPFEIEGTIRWGTKMGITEVSMEAEVFVAKNSKYTDFAIECISNGYTPIFEWCSPKNRIVVNYSEDRLVLIAMRHMITGEYMSYDMMRYFGSRSNIDVVKQYEGTVASMQHLLEETKDSEGIEGWIVRFDDGHMVKVKGDWYVRIHKTKDSLRFEKNIVESIITGSIDDQKAFMLDEDRKRVEAFERLFWNNIRVKVEYLISLLRESRIASEGDKKTYAINFAPSHNPLTRSVMFRCWDNEENVRATVLDIISRNCGSQTKLDSVRDLFLGIKWDYTDEIG